MREKIMIIWRGFGWLVPIIFIGVIIGGRLSVDSVLGISNSFKTYEWLSYVLTGIAALMVAALGYFLNHKKKIVIRDEESGKVISKSPSHSLFFIPIEYWAIILPLLLGWVANESMKDEKRDLSYISAPMINDLYVADFSKIYKSDESEYIYGVLKVLKIENSQIHVLSSENAYTQKTGLKTEITKGKMSANNVYSSEPDIFTITELLRLREEGSIDSVYRM